MWIETQWHSSRMAAGQPLVYVAALASAPWNRRLANPEPWLQGIGTLLPAVPSELRFALNAVFNWDMEVDLDYTLYLGQTFYNSKNMMDLGYDSDAEMTYFEFGVVHSLRSEEEENEF